MSDNNEDLELQNEDEQKEKEVESSTEQVSTEKKESKKEDKSLDVEALTKALRAEVTEAVRKEEKEKLYKSFEKYKEDAKLAEEAKKAAEEKLKDYETSKLTVEEQATLKLQQLEEANLKLQIQMQELVEDANSKITNLQLELIKKEILAKYDDEIIPALVSGSSIEEIQESAENAHREYISIREREIAKLKDASKPKEKIGTGIAPQSDKLNTGTTVAEINKINDPETWKANRDRFLQEALKS